MIITKYGDLNNVGKSKRIEVACSECRTEVILEEHEYSLGKPVEWDYKALDAWGAPAWFSKTYGHEVNFDCPMCGVMRTGKVFYSKMGKFYDSGFGIWAGRHKIGLTTLAWILGICGASVGLIVLIICLTA